MKILWLVCFFVLSMSGAPTVHSFSQLAQHHCSSFNIDLLLRLSTGTLSEKYGQRLTEIDCYIRQFVSRDGQGIVQMEQQEGQQGQQEQQEQQETAGIDPIVQEYASGLECVKEQGRVEAVYAMWRFIRFIVQQDYALEWIRARVRACIGYEAERPSAWMDGEQGSDRIRLQKLFSNEFYAYIDTLMFRDFLHPLLSMLRANTVIAVKGAYTASKRPMLLQSVTVRSVTQRVFSAVEMSIGGMSGLVFTIPGIPLLFSGATSDVAWAFTGVLVDRTNIEQIETVDNKFFHYESEEWIKLDRMETKINVLGAEQYTCSYHYSKYGTLYEKRSDQKKQQEYIVKWHEREKRVRVVFSEMWNILRVSGGMPLPTAKDLYFPFNSLIIVNKTNIYTLLCFPAHASYFIYADLTQPGQHGKDKWLRSTRDYLVVVNNRLSTTKPLSYLKEQNHNKIEEAIRAGLRSKGTIHDITQLQDMLEYGRKSHDVLMVRQHMIDIYRSVKYSFLDEDTRKQCDVLVWYVDQWDGTSRDIGYIVHTLWLYIVKDSTFNHMSRHPLALHLLRHTLLADSYWQQQGANWMKHGVSFGECENEQFDLHFKRKLNGTGHNSSCYHVVMMAINHTLHILKQYASDPKHLNAEWFGTKGVLDVMHGYVGNVTEEAFGKYEREGVFLAAEVGGRVVYRQSEESTIGEEVDIGEL